MGRKQNGEMGRREQILEAAQLLFLSQGFDSTSIRAIMKQAGGEIGLFYYYFRSKDDVFDQMLDRFFAGYEADFEQILVQGRRNPCRLLEVFFEYVEQQTIRFRREYAPNMHRTMRWAIREHTMEIVEPYVQRIVRIQSAYYGVTPAIDPEVTAVYLTYGVCSSILHEDNAVYARHRSGIKQGVSLLMNMPIPEQSLRIPFPAVDADMPGWMALLDGVADQFPGLDRADYQRQLAQRIAAGEAWVIRHEGGIAGALLLSKTHSEIDFLAVHPNWRRMGIASRLVETAAAQMPVGAALGVVTYRDDDPKGEAARSFYRSLGFDGTGETQAFGYPCQRMTLPVCDVSPVRFQCSEENHSLQQCEGGNGQ